MHLSIFCDFIDGFGDMNGTVSGLNGVQTQAFDVTIPLSIDGVSLTKVISRIQWNQNKVTVRNAGAV